MTLDAILRIHYETNSRLRARYGVMNLLPLLENYTRIADHWADEHFLEDGGSSDLENAVIAGTTISKSHRRAGRRSSTAPATLLTVGPELGGYSPASPVFSHVSPAFSQGTRASLSCFSHKEQKEHEGEGLPTSPHYSPTSPASIADYSMEVSFPARSATARSSSNGLERLQNQGAQSPHEEDDFDQKIDEFLSTFTSLTREELQAIENIDVSQEA